MEDFRRYLADHHGVFTRACARGFGFSDSQIHRRLRNGDWLRVAPRVIRLATAPNTWSAGARAAALTCRGWISHTGALRVRQVDGFGTHRRLHVVTDGNRRPNDSLAIVHRVRGLRDTDGRLIDGIPVTTVERSVIDSATVLRVDQIDPLVDAVVRQRLTTIVDLQAEVDRLGTRGRRNLGVLHTILAERDPTAQVPDSRFNRLVGQLLASAGLPEPMYEFVVRDSQASFVARADLAYPKAALLIECDSARWHRNRLSFENDPRRRNRLMRAGYRLLSFTWDDYQNRPSELVAMVAGARCDGMRGLEQNAS